MRQECLMTVDLGKLAAALNARPGATMAEVAAVAGISRATLHRRFPSRADLLSELAQEAVSTAGAALRAAKPTQGNAGVALDRVVHALVPIGATFAFVLREGAWLDDVPAVARQLTEIEGTLAKLVAKGRSDGSLRLDLPASYQVRLILAAITTAWEAQAAGEVGAKEAPALAASVLRNGIGT